MLLDYYVVLLFGMCFDCMNLIKVLAMNKLALVTISATSRSHFVPLLTHFGFVVFVEALR